MISLETYPVNTKGYGVLLRLCRSLTKIKGQGRAAKGSMHGVMAGTMVKFFLHSWNREHIPR